MRLRMIQDRAAQLSSWVLITSLVGACSTGPTAPAGLRLSVTTTGEDQDYDGYVYSLDANPPAPLGLNATVTLGGLDAGTHQLVINGVAGNCTLAGGPTRSIALSSGDTTEVQLLIACIAIPVPGALQITTITTGDADPDGYTYSLDGAIPVTIGSNASVMITGLTSGAHQLAIGGVASTCTLAGGTSRSVTLSAGAITQVQLTVTCQASSPTVVAIVPLQGSPYGVAVSAAGVIYAAQIGSSTLARGDLSSKSFTSSVTVGSTPPHVVFNPAGTTAYATLQTGQGLAVVDAATNTVTTTLPVGAAANGLAFSPDGTALYVSSRDAGTVVAIDPATNTITRTYTLGGMPQRLAVAPDGSELYVGNEVSGLDVVDVASGTVNSISFGTAAYGLGLTPDGAQIYILLPQMGEVRVLNRASRTAVKTLPIGGTPRNVVFASDGTALVANEQAIIFIH